MSHKLGMMLSLCHIHFFYSLVDLLHGHWRICTFALDNGELGPAALRFWSRHAQFLAQQ